MYIIKDKLKIEDYRLQFFSLKTLGFNDSEETIGSELIIYNCLLFILLLFTKSNLYVILFICKYGGKKMLDYIIIGLLIVIIILVIIAISKNVNEGKITERLGNLETTTVKELSSFQIDIMKTMNDNFNGLNERIEKKLSQINDKVNERLDDNFAKTNRTFTNILERLSRIDEAQKKIDTLSTDIVSLQSILTDKKSRGIFGEINLKHILVSIFGEKK